MDPDATRGPPRGGRGAGGVSRVGGGELHHGPGHRRGRRNRLKCAPQAVAGRGPRRPRRGYAEVRAAGRRGAGAQTADARLYRGGSLSMEPDTAKSWTRPEVRSSVGKLIVESLGVDEADVTADAVLIRDLGAESIDCLDLSFKCQQTFAVDLPMRTIQDRRIEWRDLSVLAGVLAARYRIAVTAEELRMVAPATVGAILEFLAARHGGPRVAGGAQEVIGALVVRMLADLAHTPLDPADLTGDRFGGY